MNWKAHLKAIAIMGAVASLIFLLNIYPIVGAVICISGLIGLLYYLILMGFCK